MKMKLPTHYIRQVEEQALNNGAPWLVYGSLARDETFIAIDGRKYPASMAVPIDQPNDSARENPPRK
ncbi:hypothetical protein [Thiobacillus sp.]|uniref:hypothetical protein n=1 Tax=Thiobacillus sp. TaxID=924 RepID=UPI0025E75960|nr:hypothetical protein [Thiobacillus sp.]